ncbi:rRNA processing/ribosome biogenesis-domain-containing protein, partial [Elsinoe ampelina]
MAPARDAPGVANLRFISFRLSSTKAVHLPHVVASQIQTIRDCGELLSIPRANSQSAGEAGLVVHRFYTQIAALNQGRTVEERWSAAVLIKATVEAGGYESLSKSKHWVSGLLSNLRKPDPPSTRALYITTLTRIFVLTWPYPSLVREITTPSLSPFIKTCLGNITAPTRDESELRIVLESLICLVSHHHTTFRTHVRDIGNVLRNETGSTDVQASIPGKVLHPSTRDTAARLSAALHQCEPKQGYATSWENEISSLVEDSHRFLNAVLSGVEEDLDSALSAAKAEVVKYFHTQPSDRRVAAIQTNAQTVVYTLEKVLHHILSDSTGPITFKMHLVNSVIQRICTMVNSVPADGPAVRFAVDVTRDERDACVAVLPELHTAALQLLQGILARFPNSNAYLAQSWIPLLRWVFQAEHPQLDVRLACYRTAQKILIAAGSTLSREVTEQLYPIIKAACADLVGSVDSAIRISHAGTNASADGLLKQASKSDQRRVLLPAGLRVASSELLLAAQTHLSADNISADVRTEMDRTAILIQQKDAILASVLNPRVKQDGSRESSLLPFLAHAAKSDASLKAILQPRVPVLHSG